MLSREESNSTAGVSWSSTAAAAAGVAGALVRNKVVYSIHLATLPRLYTIMSDLRTRRTQTRV